MESALVGVWGALTVMNLLCTVFLIVRAYRTGSIDSLQSNVRQLAIDVEELYGAVEKWTKRRYAAEARAKIGESAVPAAPNPADKGAYKAYLRAKAKGQVMSQ